MRVLKLLLCALVVCNLFFILASKALAQVPKPYVPVGQTKDDEWHSLRPYQASPANIPINPNEQALLCGNDLIINDTIYIPQDKHDVLRCTPPCNENSCTNGKINCWVRAPREFIISFDAYDSELPIAGNTELVKGDDLTGLKSVLNLFNQNWRLKRDGDDEGFKEHKPPDVAEYPDYSDYYEAYMEWRGKTCISTNDIPLIGKYLPDVMICYEDPTNPNLWANLYPDIPYSSTEDRIGKAHVDDMVWVKEKSTVDEVEGLNTEWNPKPRPDDRNQNTSDQETVLYFPHMEENVELSSLLQSTYLPQELQTVKPSPGPNVEPSPEPNQDCKIVNVRYNPGDQLFGERVGQTAGLGVPNANVNYRALFWCEGECRITPFGCVRTVSCTKNAWFYSDVKTSTPLIDELFGRTITNESSVMRKIFPRAEEGGALEKIEDIPASTSVGHIGIDVKSHVETISAPAEFYIPHFGSIYDYLLYDMQTLLRPKGFSGKPAGLTKSSTIPEIDQANEYLSWYLNGAIYRAEQAPLRAKDDADRVVNQSGPLNKLLSQQSQWRNTYQTYKDSFVKSLTSRVGQTDPRATTNRHNQIAGCTAGLNIFGVEIGGIPIPCESESQKNLPSEAVPPGPPPPPFGTCPNVPDSQVDSKYLGSMKANYKRMASGYGSCDLVDECYNYVVSESKKAGVNPAFSLTLWLHESGASSYCTAGEKVEDFGIHTLPGGDIVGQLAQWLEIGKTSAACSWCYNQGGWTEPMQAFLYNYWTGACDPSGDQSFYNSMKEMFQWICDPINYCLDAGGGGFKINCPNDNSCP